MADDRCEVLCLDLPRAEELRRGRLSVADARGYAARARALADPTRLTVAAALDSGGELCVCDAAWVLERAHNLVSHHLRALRDAGLATTRREGRTVFYVLTDEGRSLLHSVLAASAGATASEVAVARG